MTTSLQTATLLPMIVPFSERLSETWLLERTYHAQLWSGKELSVPDLTLAMKQLNDFERPLQRAQFLALARSWSVCSSEHSPLAIHPSERRQLLVVQPVHLLEDGWSSCEPW